MLLWQLNNNNQHLETLHDETENNHHRQQLMFTNKSNFENWRKTHQYHLFFPFWVNLVFFKFFSKTIFVIDKQQSKASRKLNCKNIVDRNNMYNFFKLIAFFVDDILKII